MNQSELENKIQLMSDKNVIDLEKRYGQSEFKDTVITFLKSKPHKLLLLESSDTSASAWKLLQVLTELQCLSDHLVSNDYLGSQNRTMLNWEQIWEMLRSSEAVPEFINLIACEMGAFEKCETDDHKLIDYITERISFNINKKIIFIISSKDKVFFKKVKSDSSIYFNEFENTVVPLYDFDTDSLIERASIGDVSAVKAILDNGVDVNGCWGDGGATALHMAAIDGCKDVVLVLLSNGANHLPCEGTDGDTPLHLAAANGHEDVVKLFLEINVDVNIKGSFRKTALHYAAERGPIDFVLTLLKHGAKLFPDIHKDTPLHDAARGGHDDIVKLFLENDIDVNIKGSWKRTALHYAVYYGHKDLVLTLLKHGAKLLPDIHKDTPLHYAANWGYDDIVKLFLETDVDLNTKGSKGMTALHIAVRKNYKNMIVTLVEKGAKMNIKDDNDETAIDLAQNQNDIIKLLIKEGGNN